MTRSKHLSLIQSQISFIKFEVIEAYGFFHIFVEMTQKSKAKFESNTYR